MLEGLHNDASILLHPTTAFLCLRYPLFFASLLSISDVFAGARIYCRDFRSLFLEK